MESAWLSLTQIVGRAFGVDQDEVTRFAAWQLFGPSVGATSPDVGSVLYLIALAMAGIAGYILGRCHRLPAAQKPMRDLSAAGVSPQRQRANSGPALARVCTTPTASWELGSLKRAPISPATKQLRLPTTWEMKRRVAGDDPEAVRMRFVHINDVYTLDNLPRLRSLLVDCAKGLPIDNLVVTIGGDLLSPYPLSALDKGKGMVDVLLACGVRYACFGNHEADVGLTALRARVEQWRQGRGVWLNTNMPELLPDLALPTHAPIVAYSHDETSTRRVCLLGVCTNDPSLYVPPENFGGAIESAEDCNTSALSFARRLKLSRSRAASPRDGAEDAGENLDEDGQFDAVVVLTHQDTEPDRQLARSGREVGIPLVLGGHDHEEYLEEHNNCVMAKAGQDAVKAVVVDLLWPEATDVEPVIDFKALLPVSGYSVSKPVGLAANGHMEKLWQLERLKGAMALTYFDADPLISSKSIRMHQTTMGSYLCNCILRELDVDCVLFDGGNIRGNRDYKPVEGHHRGPRWAFTMADLELELPWPSQFVTVLMRGQEIAEAVVWSRSHLPVLFGGFLQTDDGVILEAQEDVNVVTHIAGEPFNNGRIYRVALMQASLSGMNNNPAFKKWREHPGNLVPPDDAGRPVKTLLLGYWSRETWKDLPSFQAMDGGKGLLTGADIRNAYVSAFKTGDPSLVSSDQVVDAAVERLIAAADLSGDGKVSREEYERLFKLPAWATLIRLPSSPLISSKGVRERSSTMAKLLCNGFRDEMEVDIVLFDGGNIRGDRDYIPVPGHRRGCKWEFTLRDLKCELPWPSCMVTISMLGSAVAEAIQWSRSRPQPCFPGFLQTDSGAKFCDQDQAELTHIAKQPLEPSRIYTVGLMHGSLAGMNHNPIFKAWRQDNDMPSPGPAAVTLLLRHFTRAIWARMPDFDSVDTDGDGLVSWEQLREPVLRVFYDAHEARSGKRVNGLLRRLLLVAKLDSQSRVSREEYERLRVQSRKIAAECDFSDSDDGIPVLHTNSV